ncbi:MAG: prolipoprotein diacylglyceryl transferase, partial [Oscillospiraceae bacterium]|nr:prolipoprotein diacylglyceryl transferase [Oscillospiraceae bacterium]
MLPVLHVFGGAVQTYYVCAALAALTGYLLAVFRLRRILPRAQAWLLPLLMLLLGLIGARGLNVLTNPEAYENFQPWTLQYTKLSLMGGLGLGAVGLLLFCAVSRRAPGPVLDAFVLPSAAGIVLLKIGCFCNRCCFGKPTEGPFGMIFPANAAKYAFLESLPLVKPTSPVVHP